MRMLQECHIKVTVCRYAWTCVVLVLPWGIKREKLLTFRLGLVWSGSLYELHTGCVFVKRTEMCALGNCLLQKWFEIVCLVMYRRNVIEGVGTSKVTAVVGRSFRCSPIPLFQIMCWGMDIVNCVESLWFPSLLVGYCIISVEGMKGWK